MTKSTTPVFFQGNLESAAEVCLTATNDGRFYQAWAKKAIVKLGSEFRDRRDEYHPLIAVHVWDTYVVHACGSYRRITLSGISLDLRERVALARMLELKYREHVLREAGATDPDDYIREYDCDADLKRLSCEY